MVDSIGSRLVTAGQAPTKVAATSPVTAPEPSVQSQIPKPSSPAQLSGTARTLAASPPVDLERVARIKKAVAEGNFPILPSTIADRMIALRLDWVARDEA